MKSVMMSCSPRECCNILNYIQSILVRKKFPEDYKGWVYIYCTKGKETLAINPYGGYALVPNKYGNEYFNGKVVARFYCDKVTEYINGGRWNDDNTFGSYDDYIKDNVCGEACITEEELYNYCEDLAFSAIHISQLEIFDKPKELLEYWKLTDDYYWNGKWYHNPLDKAPKNYQWIW